MGAVNSGRMSAELDAEEHVVFHIGMRINRLRAVREWVPTFVAMPRMLRELERRPELGLLDARTFVSGRTILVVQHWVGIDQLYDYARDRTGEHLPAWREFNRRARGSGAVGIFHETYRVTPGGHETVYVDMPAFGLGAAGRLVPADRLGRTAHRRLTRTGPDDPAVPTPPAPEAPASAIAGGER